MLASNIRVAERSTASVVAPFSCFPTTLVQVMAAIMVILAAAAPVVAGEGRDVTRAEAGPGCDQALRRDYRYPAGAITGERLRVLMDNVESQVVSGLPEAERIAARKQYRRLAEQKLATVKAVRLEIERTYRSFPDERRAHLQAEYEAALRDIANVEERVLYGFAYVDSDEQQTKILQFGVEQVNEWRSGMLGWGIGHVSGVWPTAFFTNAADLATLGACRVAAGDWAGAWLLESGTVFVPGRRFLAEMRISVQEKEAPDASHLPTPK